MTPSPEALAKAESARKPELLPCPFCGGEASWDTDICDDPHSGWTVTCLTTPCPAAIYRSDNPYPTVDDAIIAWNIRVPTAAHAAGQREGERVGFRKGRDAAFEISRKYQARPALREAIRHLEPEQ